MVAENGVFYLKGIISFVATPECDQNYPDGHISVAHFLPWIKSVAGLVGEEK